jgi:hypothetical protein
MKKQHFRPAGPPGRGDKYLRDVARDVQRAIRAAQHDYHDESLRLRPADLAELSLILAEFAEDLHNDHRHLANVRRLQPAVVRSPAADCGGM